MKKIVRVFLILICISAFASLIVFAANDVDNGAIPKAPLSAEYKDAEPGDNGPILLVTLQNYQSVDSVVIYFGNELGRFSADADEIRCEINVLAPIPAEATKLWVYTENELGLSSGGCSVDMYESLSRSRIGGAEAPDNRLEAYAVVVIIAAAVISSVGYIFLRDPSKKEDGKEERKE